MMGIPKKRFRKLIAMLAALLVVLGVPLTASTAFAGVAIAEATITPTGNGGQGSVAMTDNQAGAVTFHIQYSQPDGTYVTVTSHTIAAITENLARTEEVTYTGLAEGQTIQVVADGIPQVLDSYTRPVVTPPEPVSVTPLPVGWDGAVVTIPVADGHYVYKDKVTGAVLAAGVYPVAAGATLSVVAESTNVDTVLTVTDMGSFTHVVVVLPTAQVPTVVQSGNTLTIGTVPAGLIVVLVENGQPGVGLASGQVVTMTPGVSYTVNSSVAQPATVTLAGPEVQGPYVYTAPVTSLPPVVVLSGTTNAPSAGKNGSATFQVTNPNEVDITYQVNASGGSNPNMTVRAGETGILVIDRPSGNYTLTLRAAGLVTNPVAFSIGQDTVTPPGPAKITVPAVTFTDATTANPTNNTYTIPSKDGVVYQDEAGTIIKAGTYTHVGAGKIVVTAKATAPDTIIEGDSSWEHTFKVVVAPTPTPKPTASSTPTATPTRTPSATPSSTPSSSPSATTPAPTKSSPAPTKKQQVTKTAAPAVVVGHDHLGNPDLAAAGAAESAQGTGLNPIGLCLLALGAGLFLYLAVSRRGARFGFRRH